jgi:hypothetical protein
MLNIFEIGNIFEKILRRGGPARHFAPARRERTGPSRKQKGGANCVRPAFKVYF